MSVKLSVNLNAVAMLRNRRDLPWPSVTHLGSLALKAGGHGITVHPRPDQRHIRFTDLPLLRALTTEHSAEFNVEGYPSEEFLQLVLTHRPDQVTLVPDDPQQSTSDHGWDFVQHREFLTRVVSQLHQRIPRVSLFCDPDASEPALRAAKATGTDRIEIYTGPYGATYDNAAAEIRELEKISCTATLADQLELGINAGHDLTVTNLPGLVHMVPQLLEVSIGHALVSEALEFGITEAIFRFKHAANPKSQFK